MTVVLIFYARYSKNILKEIAIEDLCISHRRTSTLLAWYCECNVNSMEMYMIRRKSITRTKRLAISPTSHATRGKQRQV